MTETLVTDGKAKYFLTDFETESCSEYYYKEYFSKCKAGAENGESQALCNLGVCYAVGLGVEKDIKKAIRNFEQSVDMENTIAMFNLAMCHGSCDDDYYGKTRAAHWFRECAERKKTQSAFTLPVYNVRAVN